jgi:CHAT domain
MIGEHPRRHRILFLAANPPSTARLALDEECAAIERELRLTSDRDDFEFRSKWAVNVDEMMRYLNELQPTVIHFSGHGDAGSELHVLEVLQSSMHRDIAESAAAGIHLHGEADRSQTVGAYALAEMIRTAAPSARIVVLNACFSDAVAAALTRTVDCVVGMRGSIGDVAARSFSVGFYRALGYGRSIGNAVAQANAGLAALQLPEHVLPICRTREDIDVDRMMLPGPPPHHPQTSSHTDGVQDSDRSFGAARKLLSILGVERPPADDELFAASLAHYNSVVRAVKDFKEIFFERLIQWIDQHVFHTFVADDDWRTKLARYAPESERYVSIAVRGYFESEKCKLEIGLWWQDSKVVIYAGLHDLPWGKKVRATKKDTRRDVFETAYLFRDATHAADPDSLLDELEAAARIACTA